MLYVLYYDFNLLCQRWTPFVGDLVCYFHNTHCNCLFFDLCDRSFLYTSSSIVAMGMKGGTEGARSLSKCL